MRPIHVPLSVRGRVRWSVYDERGERESVRVTYPDGREAFLSGGHWSPNLITNLGMNAFADAAPGWVGLNGVGSASVRRFGRIGTGSTEPAFTDTTLDNMVACSNSAAPFDNDAFSAVEGVGTITLQCMRRVTFVMDQNRNLTEFGFGNTKGGEWVEDTGWDGNPANCSGEIGVLDASTCMGKIVPAGSGQTERCWSWQDFNDIYVRELFRDSGGTPITISILSGKTLRIDHVYDITLDLTMQTGSFDVDEYDAANQYVGTTAIDYHARWWAKRTTQGTPSQNGRHLAAAMMVLPANTAFFAGSTIHNGVIYSETLNPDISSGPYLGHNEPAGYVSALATTWGSDGVVMANRPYVANSHERVYDMTVSAARGNLDWSGWGYVRRTNYAGWQDQGGGFVVAFRNNHVFTKVDTHTLRWSIKWSWARG